MTLYKYLDPNLKIIFNSLEIRFTQPEFFNDPFESFPFIQQLITKDKFDNLLASEFSEDDSNKFIKENIAATLNENFPLLTPGQRVEIENNPELIDYLKLQFPEFISNAKEILTQSSNDKWLKLSTTIKERINNNFGILCLSETNDNLIMWAHYANSHKGFLIGFDSNNTFFNQKISQTDTIRFVKPITYANKRSPLTLLKENISEDDAGEELISQLFFTKSRHWEGEKEWRMILPLKDSSRVENERYLFKVPENAITEVIFGCKMQQKEKEKILDVIKKNKKLSHIKIKEAKLSFGEFSLSITDM